MKIQLITSFFIMIKLIKGSLIQEKIAIEYLEQIDVNPTSDIQLFKKYLDEDCKMVWMIYQDPEEAKGIEEIKSHTIAYWRFTPDAKHKFKNVISKGNVVFVEGVYSGTFLNGQKLELPYIIKFTMNVNKIKSIIAYSDYGNNFNST